MKTVTLTIGESRIDARVPTHVKAADGGGEAVFTPSPDKVARLRAGVATLSAQSKSMALRGC